MHDVPSSPDHNPDRPPISCDDLAVVSQVSGWIGIVTTTVTGAWESYSYGMASPLPIYVGLGTSAFALVVGVVVMWADARRGRR